MEELSHFLSLGSKRERMVFSRSDGGSQSPQDARSCHARGVPERMHVKDEFVPQGAHGPHSSWIRFDLGVRVYILVTVTAQTPSK